LHIHLKIHLQYIKFFEDFDLFNETFCSLLSHE
jgi:hypothetical protein